MAFVVPLLVTSWWVGRFHLSISVVSEVPLSALLYEEFFDEENAKFAFSEGANAPSGRFQQPERKGNGFLALVSCGGKSDMYGRDLSYSEARYIVLRCQHSDGTETWKMAEIPKGRGARSMTLSIP